MRLSTCFSAPVLDVNTPAASRAHYLAHQLLDLAALSELEAKASISRPAQEADRTLESALRCCLPSIRENNNNYTRDPQVRLDYAASFVMTSCTGGLCACFARLVRLI